MSGGIGRACPGKCGRTIPVNRYACPGCWRRVPAGLRFAIARSWGRRIHGVPGAKEAHQEATAAADAWLSEHPR